MAPQVTRVALRVDIAVPVAEAFEYVADYRNALTYMENFHAFAAAGGPGRGLGAIVRASGRLRGIPVTTELEIVAFEQNRRIVSVSRRGVRSSSEWSFEAIEAGTMVTFTAEYALPRVPLAGAIVTRLLTEEIASGARRTLERLKSVLEGPDRGRQRSESGA